MSIDIKKMAKDAVGAIFDDYEDERIMSRERWESVVEKALKPHVDKVTPGYGGYGVGAYFKPLGDDIHVYRLSEIRGDHPLLPDAD